jgi:glycosyltransferase involved in cell wall biosynthesis
MDLRARRKLAFVVERYGAEEPAEFVRRTRALASAMADRGHDVTVLTSCSRLGDDWTNEYAEGESPLDGVRVVRFASQGPRHTRRERLLAHPLVQRFAWAQQAWLQAAGPISPALQQYLRRFGPLFDAVFFTGAWTALPLQGMALVRNPVLAPAPMVDPSHRRGHAGALLASARAVLAASPEHLQALAKEAQAALSDPVVVGACCEPLLKIESHASYQPVRGPFILYAGDQGPHVRRLAAAFRVFRDAHALTPFEDDVEGSFEGRDLRLVLAGDFEHEHAPEDRIVALGPVDDNVRQSLLASALAAIHCDRRLLLPVALIEAWTAGRPAILLDPHPLLAQATHPWASEYSCDPSAFASCLAALLSRRGPRVVIAARARRHARRAFDAGSVMTALEACVERLRAMSAA